jgi:hypothetical protein
MSQTLQNQILLAKSMNGIVTLSDGAGTTISNGSINTSNVNSSNITTNNLSLSALDLNSSLTLEQYDDINTGTGLGLVSLWEKGKSYFTYLPQSLATPTLDSELITRLFANNNYGRLTISNTWSATNNFTGGINVGGVPIAVTYRTGGSNSNFNTDLQPFQFITATADNNMAYGIEALQSITTGDSNSAFGYAALKRLTTGGSNTAFGNFALQYCTTGILNLAFGYNAGEKMVSSIATTCIGYNAGLGGFQGNFVNLFGISSYIASAGLEYSTCLGTGSFIDANNQIALGTSADTVVVRGNTNLTAGTATTTTQATSDNSTKIATTAFVKNQAYAITSSSNTWTGTNNDFTGSIITATTQALLDNTTKVSTTAFTQSAINRLLYLDAADNQKFYTTKFPALTSGYRNIGIGDCFNALTSGGENCCIGSLSMKKLTTGTENFCLGGLSMREITTGSFNVSVGVQNLVNGVTIGGNVAIGRYVMGSASGNENTGVGYFSTVQISTGNLNTGVGAYSNIRLQSGSNNTAVGSNAGGHDLNSLINASNNTYIGANAYMSGGTTFSNSTCIGYNSRITASNQIILGTSNEVTIAMGGLTVPIFETLTVDGTMVVNSVRFENSPMQTAAFTVASDGYYWRTYLFTNPTTSPYAVTVPEITVLNYGKQMTFRRVGGQLQALSIIPANTTGSWVFRQIVFMTASTSVIYNGSTPIYLVNSSPNQYSATIVSAKIQEVGGGTATWSGASTTITVLTTSTNIMIGGVIRLGPVNLAQFRQITAYGTGFGGTGTYVINALPSGSATGGILATGESYGWMLTSQQ